MLKQFGQFIEEFSHYRPHAMIDKAHISLIFSTMISSKPDSILEIGIGTGMVTYALLHAREYNGKGNITSVDNWHDWEGNRPPEISNLEKYGVSIIEQDEETFVKTCESKFDFIVVDGDHTNGHKWVNEIFNLANPGAIIFSHDINLFPALIEYKNVAISRKANFKLFDKSSRPDERCERGFIVIYL